MARPLGTGPIYVFIGFGPPVGSTIPGTTPVGPGSAQFGYYGTTRQGVEINERVDYYPVMNDITGPSLPMDMGYAGREDDIGLTMSSWSQTVENALEAIPTANGPAPNLRGTTPVSALGTLMLSEGATVGIWLLKASALKAVNVASGMSMGRYYPTCIMVGPSQPVMGNKENLMIRRFTAKKNIYGLNAVPAVLPLFFEDNAQFTPILSLPSTNGGIFFG